jgi:signal-transduction protein with cAMP-binding, CBS, and nucleotidyltransferase domain
LALACTRKSVYSFDKNPELYNKRYDMRSVKELLESKPVVFNNIDADTLVINALQMLNSVNLSYLVVKRDDEFKGIFCERDYSRNVILKGRSSSNTKVNEVMTNDLPMVDISDTVEHCMNLMISHRARYILAYNDQQFAGIITIHDLLRQVISNKEMVFDNTMAEQLLSHEEGRIY